MAAATTTQHHRNMADFRAKRTEAMPKNSLFGSVLENKTKEELEALKDIDIRKVQFDEYKPIKRPPREWVLPDHIKVKHRFAGDERFVDAKLGLEQKMKEAADARSNADKLTEQSMYFQAPHANIAAASTYKPPTPKPNTWHNPGHVNNAEQINILGLQGTGAYDHQKHLNKPPVHQYSMIGDPLRTGMEFRGKQADPYKGHMFPLDRKTYANRPTLPQTVRYPIGDGSHGMADLPPNIQHKFGTKICQSALADLDKVNQTLKDHSDIQYNIHHRRRTRSTSVPLSPGTTNPKYDEISNGLRYNIFPGYDFQPKTGLTHEVHNMDIHERRYKDPDQYRHTQDQLGFWTEHNILRQRMKKSWDDYLSELPKAEANWDRNATRPPPPKDPSPKPKPKKAKPKPKKPEMVLEDIEFKTPPLTPLKPILEPVKLQNKKDDDFWEFYDQPAPLP